VYEPYYGFREKPFNLTPDPKYLYPSQRHTEAIAHLEFGRRERGGFVVITGEVGTGKTTLARSFLSKVDSRTATAFVIYPALTAAELLGSILEDFRVPVNGPSLKDHVDALHRFLLQARREGREVVLVIDEAQDLAIEVLEQIRLISNLETDTEKLIQIVLMGQSELNEMLSRRELRQIAQRVTARYHLGPLSRRETEDYVRHRLGVAGGEGKVSFTGGALAAVHDTARGVPRLINLVCDRALLAGYVEGTRVIHAGLVKRAAKELRPKPIVSFLRTPYAVAGAVLALVAAVGYVTLRRAPAATAATPISSAALTATLPPPSTAVPVTVAPVPSTVVAAPPAAVIEASTRLLEPLVLSLDHDASLEASATQIQALWGGGALLRTPLRTHLDQIRRLDLPVVLEMFHPARRDTAFVALIHLDGDLATLAPPTGGLLQVPVRELDRLWTRQALFLWRDFDALGQRHNAVRTAAWTRDNLARLGYLSGGLDLTAAVIRFQRDAELTVDGVIGARTLMTLYSLGEYHRPRLQGAPRGNS
jgi:general secretion pathway protein A